MLYLIIFAAIVGVLLLLYFLITKNDIVCHSICAAIALVGIILCYTVGKGDMGGIIGIAAITAFIWSIFTFNGTESEVTITEFLGGWYQVVEESGLKVKCTLVLCTTGITSLIAWLAMPWGAGVILGIMMAFNLFIVIMGIKTEYL